MSARDELARVIYEHGPRLLQGGNPTWDAAADMGLQRAPYEQADAVLSEWLPTLADDEALIVRLAEAHMTAWSLNTATREGWDDLQAHNRGMTTATLLALAAALTPPP